MTTPLELVDELAAVRGDAAVGFDRNLHVTHWSAAAERRTGIAASDAAGCTLRALLPELAERDLLAALAGRASCSPDRDASFAPLRDGAAIIGGIAVLHAPAPAPSETEQRFQHMADVAPVLLWMARPDSMCTFFNQTWLDFTGRTLEQEWGVGWAESVHFEDLQRCMDCYVDAFNARRTFELEYRLRRADGEFRWVLDRGTPRYDRDGGFCGFIGSCVDITDLRHATTIKEAFLGMVSHELRTPLTALSLVLERLRIEGGDPLTAAQQALLARMERALHRMSQLVESLLQYSRIERRNLRVNRFELDLVAQVELAIDPLRPAAARKGLALAIDAPAPLPAITSDPDLLRLIIANLVGNAIKFTDAGSVTIALSHGHSGHRIEVIDTGRGIPAAVQARVFEPFEQLEPHSKKHTPGVGLGLALVKAMSSALGGRVELDSKPGRGSRFSVQFPPLQDALDAQLHPDRRGR